MVATDPILLNNWHAVALVEDCQPGKIVKARLLGEDLVIWRPEEPHSPIQVWQDYCPHRGARLSLGKACSHTLVCPYHGWEYDSAGICVHIPAHPQLKPPAAARIKTYHCRERYGLVWVCLGKPSGEVPDYPEWEDPGYQGFCCGPLPCNTSPFRVLENLIDVSHFPFVHDGFFGDRLQPQVADYEVEADTDGITIRNMSIWIPSKDSTSKGQLALFYKEMRHPLVLYTSTPTVGESSAPRMATLDIATPIEEEKCVFWVLYAYNPSLVKKGHELNSNMMDKVLRQDIPVVESQRPKRLPLLTRGKADTQWPEELHVPCDRASVAYRRWLKQLGVTYGVC